MDKEERTDCCIVMEAIRVVLKKPEFTNDGARARAVQAAGKSLLDASNAVKLEDFSKYLLETLHSNLKSVQMQIKCCEKGMSVEELSQTISGYFAPDMGETVH